MAEELKIVIDADVNKAVAGVNKFKQSVEGLTTGSIKQLEKAALQLRTTLANLSPAALKSDFGRQLSASLATVNAELKTLKDESNLAGTAASGAFSKAYSGVRQLANILPRLGISGIILLASDAIIELSKSLFKASDAAIKTSSIFSDTSKEYEKAVTDVNDLRINIGLAKDGFISKDAVVKQYNETIGKTTGFVKNLDEAEQGIVKNGDAFIKFTLLKASAQIALAKASKEAFDQVLKVQKNEEDFALASPKIKAKGGVSLTATDVGAGDFNESQRRLLDEKKKIKDVSDKRISNFEQIAKDFQAQAALIATQFGFNFFGDGKKIIPKDKTDDILNRARQFVKEFSDIFVVPDLTESFFRGKKDILPDAKKLLENIKTGNLKIKLTVPVIVDTDFFPEPQPLTEAKLKEVTDNFFKSNKLERGINIDVPVIVDFTLPNKDQQAALDKLLEGFSKLGTIGFKAFEKIDFSKFNDGLKEGAKTLQNMTDIANTLSQSIGNGLANAFDNVFDAILQGKNVFKALGESVKALVVETIKAIAKMLIIKAISKAFGVGIPLPIPGVTGNSASPAGFGLGGAIGGTAFQNVLTVNVNGQISGDVIRLAGQRAAGSAGRFG
jgi:hypothetical protein